MSVLSRWRGRLKTRQGLLAAARKRLALRNRQVAQARRVLRRHSKPAPGPVVMFDSVTVNQIPKNAPAVAGYVGGNWPTYPTLVRNFPKAHKLSIAVNAGQNAECLDCEPGDANPAQVAAWVKRQQQRGIKRPVIYASVSSMQDVVARLSQAGIARSSVRLWSAHYTHKQHICGPGCGFGLKARVDATQWTDRSQGRNLDESLCNGGFFA